MSGMEGTVEGDMTGTIDGSGTDVGGGQGFALTWDRTDITMDMASITFDKTSTPVP